MEKHTNYRWGEGGQAVTFFIIIAVFAWALIPAAYLMQAYFRRRQRRVWEETEPAIRSGIAEMRKQGASGKHFADILDRPEPGLRCEHQRLPGACRYCGTMP